MKNVVILGSTGSIGTQTLNVIRRNPGKFKVIGLVAHTNYQLLKEQAEEFMPDYVGMTDEKAYARLALSYKCHTDCGAHVLADFAALPECDTVVCAVVGMSGFDGVVSAIKHNKQVALANKEVLVAGGEFVMSMAREKDVKILPVDSEHSAVWQCLDGKDPGEIGQIILTASGGPFRAVTDCEFLKSVTPEMAVAHPNWKMGKKISVDSATMMNKGLEMIEARWLFDTQNVDYIIHPQSVIHSMVRFIDGSILAQISNPNMELPIQLALGYPQRVKSNSFDFNFDKDLTFVRPNEQLFPLPAIAKQCLKSGGSLPCVMNAANEAAVALFLDSKILFTDIYTIVYKAVEQAENKQMKSVEDIKYIHESTMHKIFTEYQYITERA